MDSRIIILNQSLANNLIKATSEFLMQNLQDEENKNFVFSLIVSAHMSSLDRCLHTLFADEDNKEAKEKVEKFLKRLLDHFVYDKDVKNVEIIG